MLYCGMEGMHMRMVKATYKRRSGTFEPVEPVELPDGATVHVVVPESMTTEAAGAIVVPEPTPDAIEAFHRSAGGWRDSVPEEFIAEVYKRREMRRHPVDL